MTKREVSTRLAQIATQARKHEVVRGLAHHIDVEMLKAAYRATRRDGAVGIDGITASDYEQELEKNLLDLQTRLKSQRYRAPAVRRAYIPKEDGKKRPLGIPGYEDKLVQRATLMILEQVFEQDFYDCSYGYRPGRSAHQALQDIKEQCWKKRVSCIIDADIEGFFDSVDHTQLQALIAKRINDFSIRRLIGKWLNAGVWEEGRTHFPDTGTPQGGVISPLLANVYLHYVLDDWFVKEVQPRLKGQSFLVRYADDFVMGFEREEDGARVMEVLKQRFEEYKLTLHPAKTQLIKFQRPPRDNQRDDSGNGTFTFLGFTHHWCKSARTGNWYVRRKIASKRVTRGLRNVRQWLKAHRHRAISEQAQRLQKHLVGVYRYYGLREVIGFLGTYRREVTRHWHYWLNRRGGRRYLTWPRFADTILKRYRLPAPSLRWSQPPLITSRVATCHTRGTG